MPATHGLGQRVHRHALVEDEDRHAGIVPQLGRDQRRVGRLSGAGLAEHEGVAQVAHMQIQPEWRGAVRDIVHQGMVSVAEWAPVRLEDGTVSDGKVDTYERCVETLLGSASTFFTAVFSAQWASMSPEKFLRPRSSGGAHRGAAIKTLHARSWRSAM